MKVIKKKLKWKINGEQSVFQNLGGNMSFCGLCKSFFLISSIVEAQTFFYEGGIREESGLI
jgi:hypothetical protein